MPGKKKKNWQPAGHSGSVSICPFLVVSQTALFPRSSHLTSLRRNLIHSDTQAAAMWHCSQCCADDRYLFFFWLLTNGGRILRGNRAVLIMFISASKSTSLFYICDEHLMDQSVAVAWGVLQEIEMISVGKKKNLLHTSKKICSKSNVFSPPSSSSCYKKKMWVRCRWRPVVLCSSVFC